MKKTEAVESASAMIDKRIKDLGDWRGKTLEKVRRVIRKTDPEIVEEWKWAKATNPGTPVWSHDGNRVHGRDLQERRQADVRKGRRVEVIRRACSTPAWMGTVRRAIDIHESDKIDEAALSGLIREAIALNLGSKRKVAGCGAKGGRPASRRSTARGGKS
jgi:hypothetical protein